tara:strand:+ start:13137 stop:14138 length:1002 start_codon:yes stop_codon:yes gene_type:complete
LKNSFKIISLPGDGIGPEIMNCAINVLELVAKKFQFSFELSECLFGGISIDKYGIPLTDQTINACKNSDAILLGAVGGPKWDSLSHDIKPEAGLLKIRKELELFTNLRPAINTNNGLNIMILRELTSGIYFGQPRGYKNDKAWNTLLYTRKEVERIAHVGFKLAQKRNKKLTSVHKSNVLESSQLWKDVVHDISKDYSDVTVEDMYVDNAAMQLVQNPFQFDVILTQNLFGDILSDLSATLCGHIGLLPSASIGENIGLYEPVHGSAPDIAGKDLANPVGMILSLGMMFEHSFEILEAKEYIFNKTYEYMKRLNDEDFTIKKINSFCDFLNEE